MLRARGLGLDDSRQNGLRRCRFGNVTLDLRFRGLAIKPVSAAQPDKSSSEVTWSWKYLIGVEFRKHLLCGSVLPLRETIVSTNPGMTTGRIDGI